MDMTIDEVIQAHLKIRQYLPEIVKENLEKYIGAVDMGIEALKRHRTYRQGGVVYWGVPLPGEKQQ